MQLLKIKMFDVEKAIFCLLRLRLRFAAIVKKAKKKNRPFTVSRDGTSTYIEEPARFGVPLIKKPCMMSTTEYDNYYYFFFFEIQNNRSKAPRLLWKRNNFMQSKAGLF